ncbi:MAG: T9SS type A sorting domain-containing protein [Candidatus Eisenbacteria bacterium]|uniref:T9SS type A sorting domain-containing protein n=1 Tax=Eiseniibacteriota bacterium TaxID=2212470 RepID=A0A956N834_UNCEI|nr:T9SS type A sorting domain-containing protein [Candidatus Eisenbacteria bacterium]
MTSNVASDPMWRDVGNESAASQLGESSRAAMPNRYRLAELDLEAMELRLAEAPLEGTVPVREGLEITLPMPDGTHQRFRVVESPFIGPQVQSIIPEYRSYLAQGVDDPTAALRLDTSRVGFHAYGRTSRGTLWIDPYDRNQVDLYISAYQHDFSNPADAFECGTTPEEVGYRGGADTGGSIPTSGDTRHTYRLAMTLTGEYCEFWGGTVVATAFSTVTVNRVNSVYEVDAAIRLNYVFTQAYPDRDTDPFPTGGVVDGALLDQNQTVLDTVLGSANYDIGHIMSQGGSGGLAPGRACSSTKARGGTSRAVPSGDPFDIDFVSHEIGHQFTASHTFNGTTTGCECCRTGSSAYEPGSGSTIMGYAGLCGTEDLQANSDPYFHVRSLTQIISHRGGSGSCAPTSATGNTPPVVNAGPDHTIPRETKFYVRASVTDPDEGDAHTFAWEQYDLGAASPPLDPLGPLFRSLSPTNDPVRYFPDFTQAIVGGSDPWEILPTVDRSLTLRVTVRDNVAGGGGVDDDEIELTVAGPRFRLTSPNGGQTYVSGQPVNVTWDVGGSVGSHVEFWFWNSSSGGFTFITTTPNDGSEEIIMPCGLSASGRLWIEEATSTSLGVHIFDVSDTNITINSGLADYRPGHFGGVEDNVVFNSQNSGALPTELFGDQNSFFYRGYANSGNAWACDDFEYDLYLDERVLVESSNPIGPGPGITVNVGPGQAYVSGGRHTAWMVTDPENLNPESNESNNGYARQWVWEPQPLAPNTTTRRTQPPERFAGQDHIPSGVDFYSNMDGMRIEFTTEVWVASAISSLNGSDYDAYLFDPSTGVEDGFETPIGQSRSGGGTTDFVIVNQLIRGAQAYDIGLERYDGNGEFIADHRDVNGFSYPSGGGGSRAVASDQILDIQSLFVQANQEGPHVLQIENVSTAQPLELLLFSPGLSIGNRGNAIASATVVDGSAHIDFEATQGYWCYALVRNASEGTAGFTYDVRFRPTPPELATAVLSGSHGPIVPRPDSTIPVGDPVPAPSVLPGDSFDTTMYYHLRNESPVGADPWDFTFPVDGVEDFAGGPFPGPFPLPGGTSDIFSQALGGGFFITGGRHTVGVVYDATDSYDEVDEIDNRHAEQWVWEPTQLAIGESVSRPGPPALDGGWDDIPAGLPREYNVDGLRTPAFVNQGEDGFWGGFAAVPNSGDVGLRVHEASTGAQDGFDTVLELSDFGGNTIELVLFDLNTLGSGVAYDMGMASGVAGQDYSAYVAQSVFLSSGAPFGQSYPGALGAGQTFALYEFGTFGATGPVDVEITVENQAGDANLALAVFARTDETGIYNLTESIGLSESEPSGGSETLSLTLDADEYHAVVVLKVSGDDTGKSAEYTLHFADPATTGVDTGVLGPLVTGMVHYPEPFAGQTEIEFTLETAGPASIQVFDVSGRLVSSLVDGTFPSGRHSLTWSGHDDRGKELANGVYLARFRHAEGTETRRMVLVR